MKIKFTPFPTLLRYTKLVNKGGTQKGVLVTIDPKYVDDAGLHEHEYKHVTHFYVIAILSLIVYWFIPLNPDWKMILMFIPIFMYHILYSLIPTARMWIEIDCYRKQIKVNQHQHHVDLYASWFATKYGITKDPEWIKKKLLRRKL